MAYGAGHASPQTAGRIVAEVLIVGISLSSPTNEREAGRSDPFGTMASIYVSRPVRTQGKYTGRVNVVQQGVSSVSLCCQSVVAGLIRRPKQ
jgi:hypothetical protein